MKSFSTCVNELMDAWINSADTTQPPEIYDAVMGPAQPNVALAVIDCRCAETKDFSVEVIRTYSLSTDALDYSAPKPQDRINLQDITGVETFLDNATSTMLEVLKNKRPSLGKGQMAFSGCTVIYERLLLPQKSATRNADWCILLSKIDLLLPEVSRFNAEGIDLSILQLLTEGASQKEIGIKLQLSHRTIEHRIERLKGSVGAKNLQHLVALWISSKIT
jgi:DNA-binding CsgD family transcriptional regulator